MHQLKTLHIRLEQYFVEQLDSAKYLLMMKYFLLISCDHEQRCQIIMMNQELMLMWSGM